MAFLLSILHWILFSSIYGNNAYVGGGVGVGCGGVGGGWGWGVGVVVGCTPALDTPLDT